MIYKVKKLVEMHFKLIISYVFVRIAIGNQHNILTGFQQTATDYGIGERVFVHKHRMGFVDELNRQVVLG